MSLAIPTMLPPVQKLADGTQLVPVRLTFVIKGASVRISDHSDAPIGDACAALHVAALAAMDLTLGGGMATDRFQQKPADDDWQKNVSKATVDVKR